MNFSLLIATAFAALSSTVLAVRVGDLVAINGLTASVSLNGYVGLVQKVDVPSRSNPNELRVQVLVALSKDIRQFGDEVNGTVISAKQCMKSSLIKAENLGPIHYLNPRERSAGEILAEMLVFENESEGTISRIPSSFHREELTADQIEVTNRVICLIASIVGPESCKILDDDATYEKVRLIGAWLLANYGWDSAVRVCEANSNYYHPIERAWHGIGRWLA